MGIFNKQQDRYKNYNVRFNRPSMFGGFAFFPPVIKYLLITNIAIFLLQNFVFVNLSVGDKNLGYEFFRYFALQPVSTDPMFQTPLSGPFMPWQLFTYLFMHGGFWHLFLNMFALWMFGMELENIWGSKKFIMYYMMCGVGAGLANLFIAPLFSSVQAPTVGASGSVYGILVAFGMMFPNRPIFIYFLFPIKAKYFVVIYMLIELFSVGSNSGIAHVAHLGGALIGFFYIWITNNANISNIFRFPDKPRPTQKSTPSNVYKSKYYEKYNTGSESDDVSDADYYIEKNQSGEDKALQEKIDEILDKISKDGYKSLTDEEKRILFEASKKIH